ncbi:MAG: hypothetical protein HYS41_01545 [Candidatus Omnitrophica bacterium]|nr:hypothetical protein [Candidatus Omnitrophota bacterium]
MAILPLAVLALCLLVFYGPILLSARSFVTSTEGDPVTHMLFSMGDARPGGRFFHYFDLATDTRLWGNDIKYHPLHLIRLISIALGASPTGWGILIAGVHAALFGVVYFYSRRLGRVSRTAALAGAMTAFFATSWLEWTAKVYWTAGSVLLGVSLGEYGLWVRTAKRRHLVGCILANALQPYVTQSQALIPTQAYLLGGILGMAFLQRERWASTVRPFLTRVGPLTALGWLPIAAPMLFTVGWGFSTREALTPLGWGFAPSSLPQFLGLGFPVPESVPVLFEKLGWMDHFQPPNSWLFGSFLLVPSLLALWQSQAGSGRILAAGAAGYCLLMMAVSSLEIPSVLIRDAGFSRLFVFPLLSGGVVAAGVNLAWFADTRTRTIRFLHRLYRVILVLAVTAGGALWFLGEDRLFGVASQRGLLGSGTAFHSLFNGTWVLAAGIVLGLGGYFSFLALRRSGTPRTMGRAALLAALSLSIAAPAFGYGYGAGWYRRPPELTAMLSPPPELRFLQEKIPGYRYRVGVVVSGEMELARGNWQGFWALASQREEGVVYHLRKNEPCLRQGLAWVLPPLHFYGPVHAELRRQGNPFWRRPGTPEAQILNYRSVIVRPEEEIFEEYGVRYWISRFDLQRLHPQKFTRVFEGPYAAVYENAAAKPVAYLLDDLATPLALGETPYGAAVTLPASKGGKLSVHLDLRNMEARAVDVSGKETSLALEPSGLRWVLQVPEGSSRVLFLAKESAWLTLLAIGAGACFFLLLFAVRR